MKKEIQNALLGHGIKPQLLGFQYLTDAVQLVVTDKAYKYNVHKLLYPEIAKNQNTTVCSVERAIRHAIHNAKLPYTNLHFIALVALDVQK